MRSVEPTALARELDERRRGRHLVLLCDFDGTLCEFHPDPSAVWLPGGMRAALDAIAAQAHATVGVISGRRLDDVRERSRLAPGAYYAGLHGMEIEGPDGRFEHPQLRDARGLIRSIGAALSRELRGLDGVFIEDKDTSIVAHYRDAAPDVQELVPRIFDRAAGPYLESGTLRVMRGSCARELMPNVDWNKGSAVAWICDRVERRFGSAWPVYVGDDVTDEDAFAAVRDGVAVAASDRVRGAHYRIDGPGDVEALLNAIRSPA